MLQDKDVSRLIMQDLIRNKANDKMDMEVIEDIEHLLNNHNLFRNGMASLVVVRFSNKDGRVTSRCGTSLSPKDIIEIEKWLSSPQDSKLPFISDMYRIDLDTNILIFKEYTSTNLERVVAGYLLAKTRMVRMDLLDIQQEKIMERLWHHQKEMI